MRPAFMEPKCTILPSTSVSEFFCKDVCFRVSFLWLFFVCFLWVGASHRDNPMHLSPLDRNVQEKWVCYAFTAARLAGLSVCLECEYV